MVALIVEACTKEIKVDLNSSDPQIVIEGSVPANGEKVRIDISKSVNFDESNEFPKVQNASVVVKDNFGNAETLTESSPGVYTSLSLTGIAGRTYYLEVNCEDKNLTSFSTIPQQVKFDTLIVKKSTQSGGGPGSMASGGSGTSYEVTVGYADPVSEKNYYRFLEYVNGNYNGHYVFDDRLTNGIAVNTVLMGIKRSLKPGDTLKIEMQCIDYSVFDYFNSFGNLHGGPMNASTPANPYSNIHGSMLGYFSAHTVIRRFVVIK